MGCKFGYFIWCNDLLAAKYQVIPSKELALLQGIKIPVLIQSITNHQIFTRHLQFTHSMDINIYFSLGSCILIQVINVCCRFRNRKPYLRAVRTQSVLWRWEHSPVMTGCHSVFLQRRGPKGIWEETGKIWRCRSCTSEDLVGHPYTHTWLPLSHNATS